MRAPLLRQGSPIADGRTSHGEPVRLPTARPDDLADPRTRDLSALYGSTIENFIGTVKVPVGLAGPLRVNGTHARGEYHVPLATTEATLVASYARGASTITEAGGCTVLILDEGVSRTPAFAFDTLSTAAAFARWATDSVETFRGIAAATTRFGRLAQVHATVEGNHVYLRLEFTTGDAAGQNMVTIASEAVCRFIARCAPVPPRSWFVEANMSGDKKATAQSFMTVRGKRVGAEVILPADLVVRRLHTTARAMAGYARISEMGAVMSGSIGVQGHVANALAALFIACGQDAACVAEAAVGITRLEARDDGALYAAVTLPNVIVGTVGGGTALPSQRACLELMGLAGPNHARALAEVAAALALAGELSIVAALAAGEFTSAHQRFARGGDRARGRR